MGSIICSLLRSKMKEQQSNYQVLADPKRILQILFCSEQLESVGTKGKQALAQAVFHTGTATVFWKHQTSTQPKSEMIMKIMKNREDQSKFLESDRLLSSVCQRTAHVETKCCTPLQILSHVPNTWLSQEAVIHHCSLTQPLGLVGTVNSIPL